MGSDNAFCNAKSGVSILAASLPGMSSYVSCMFDEPNCISRLSKPGNISSTTVAMGQLLCLSGSMSIKRMRIQIVGYIGSIVHLAACPERRQLVYCFMLCCM